MPYKVQSHSINCAIAKGPDKVARDISNRLLPEYLPLLQQCETAWEAYGKAKSGLHGVADQLAKDLDGSVTYEQYQGDVSLYHSVAFPYDCVDIKVSHYPSDETAKVRISGLNVTPDECKAVFALLAEMRGKMLVMTEMRYRFSKGK